MPDGFVVTVPFQLAEKMYQAHKNGADIKTLMILGECTETVVHMILKHQKRIHMRKKYDVDKEPA